MPVNLPVPISGLYSGYEIWGRHLISALEVAMRRQELFESWVRDSILPSAVAKTSADQFTSSGTLVNVTGLVLPVKANVQYFVDCRVLWKTTDLTAGIVLAAKVPTFSIKSLIGGIAQTSDSASAVWWGHMTSDDDPVTSPSTPAQNVAHVGFIKGIFKPTADGDFQVRAAAESVAHGVTILSGSALVLMAV